MCIQKSALQRRNRDIEKEKENSKQKNRKLIEVLAMVAVAVFSAIVVGKGKIWKHKNERKIEQEIAFIGSCTPLFSSFILLCT